MESKNSFRLYSLSRVSKCHAGESSYRCLANALHDDVSYAAVNVVANFSDGCRARTWAWTAWL